MEYANLVWFWFCYISGCYCFYRLFMSVSNKLVSTYMKNRNSILTISNEITGKSETVEMTPDDEQNINEICSCNKLVQDAAKLNTKLVEQVGSEKELGEVKDTTQLKQMIGNMHLPVVGPGMSEVVIQIFYCSHEDSNYLQIVPGKKLAK